MPRYRGTKEATASLVGRLLLLIAGGKETSATLARKLGVSDRQVNRYLVQLGAAGWKIDRRGVPTHRDYWLDLVTPKIVPRKERTAVDGNKPAPKSHTRDAVPGRDPDRGGRRSRSPRGD
jgi:hypothetical protein